MRIKLMSILLPIALGVAALVALLSAGNTLADRALVAPAADATSTSSAYWWSSGWITVARGSAVTLTHNLGGDPDDYLIQMWFLDTDNGHGINIRAYGGLEKNGQWYGAAWQNLTANTIQIVRYANDTLADRIMVQVWTPLTPFDYCSDWTTVPTLTTVFTHNLGGSTADDYIVHLTFRNSANGINQRAYGGIEYGSGTHFVGGYWSHLTTSTVEVYRYINDPFAYQMRVCVTTPPARPDYDSGWVTMTSDSLITLTHDLQVPIGRYKVRLDQWSDYLGINNKDLGGAVENVIPYGANWENLTTRTVRIYSRAAQRVRLRIWVPKMVYLPLVLNNYVPPTELAYDDGGNESWQSFADLNRGFAVRFTPPDGTATLVQARYYLNTAASGHPIQVHVWDSDHNDLITPFTATPPAGIGWFDVDLTGYNLTVSDDFYVGFLYTVQHSDPSIGVDISAPDNRSYEVPWQQQGNDYMIRVTVR